MLKRCGGGEGGEAGGGGGGDGGGGGGEGGEGLPKLLELAQHPPVDGMFPHGLFWKKKNMSHVVWMRPISTAAPAAHLHGFELGF